MEGETRWWRCVTCGDVVGGIGANRAPYLCCDENADDKDLGWEPVAVLPLAEAEALQRLKAAVCDNDVEIANTGLPLTNDEQKMVRAALKAYNAALRQAMEVSK
jgi:hypothetical protein